MGKLIDIAFPKTILFIFQLIVNSVAESEQNNALFGIFPSYGVDFFNQYFFNAIIDVGSVVFIGGEIAFFIVAFSAFYHICYVCVCYLKCSDCRINHPPIFFIDEEIRVNEFVVVRIALV